MWVHPLNQTREESGEFKTLICEQLTQYPDKFYVYFRMTEVQFKDILDRLRMHIMGIGTNFRENLSPEMRLAVCLRYVMY